MSEEDAVPLKSLNGSKGGTVRIYEPEHNSDTEDDEEWDGKVSASAKPLSAVLCIVIGVGLIVLLLVILFTLPLQSEKCPGTRDYSDFLSANLVVPTHYRINLDMDFSQQTLKGWMQIDVVLTGSTTRIILNSVNIMISSATLTHIDTGADIPTDTHIQFRREEFHMVVDQCLSLNSSYRITLEFISQMTDVTNPRQGFSITRDEKNKTTGGITHMIPSYARYVFPCFDDPGTLANFTIGIKHDPSYKVFSNMAVSERSSDSTNFSTTPALAPYMIAIALSNETLKTSNIRKSEILYYPPSLSSRDVNAISTALRQISIEGKKKLVPYDKIDVLITETDFHFDPSPGFIALPISMFSNGYSENEDLPVISKAIAQQWVVSLLKIKWWQDIWLLEGYAQFISDNYLQTKDVKFQQKRNDRLQYVYQTFTGRLQPVLEVNTSPYLIQFCFDTNLHEKGAQLMRMYSSLVGDKFSLCMKQISSDIDSSAISIEQWAKAVDNCPESKMRLDSAEFLTHWLTQPYLPVVFFNVSSDSNVIQISQSAFCPLNTGINQCVLMRYNIFWHIPITLSTLSGRSQQFLILNETEGTLQNIYKNDPFIADLSGNSMLMANYPEAYYVNLLQSVIQRKHSVLQKMLFDIQTLNSNLYQPATLILDAAQKLSGISTMTDQYFAQKTILKFLFNRLTTWPNDTLVDRGSCYIHTQALRMTQLVNFCVNEITKRSTRLKTSDHDCEELFTMICFYQSPQCQGLKKRYPLSNLMKTAYKNNPSEFLIAVLHVREYSQNQAIQLLKNAKGQIDSPGTLLAIRALGSLRNTSYLDAVYKFIDNNMTSNETIKKKLLAEFFHGCFLFPPNRLQAMLLFFFEQRNKLSFDATCDQLNLLFDVISTQDQLSSYFSFRYNRVMSSCSDSTYLQQQNCPGLLWTDHNADIVPPYLLSNVKSTCT